MAKIRRGFHPTVMEQKWFIYFTGTRLRLHRSWTGLLYFDVGFAFDSQGGAFVTEVIVNRDAHSPEYECSDEEDQRLLQEIIQYHLLEPLDEPQVDGMVKALMLATQPKYLGSPEIVAAFVQDIFDVILRIVSEDATKKDLANAVAKMVFAYTDDSSDYTRMPGWHSAGQMGAAIKKYLAPTVPFDGNESLSEILETGMAAVVLKLREMLSGFIKDPAFGWEDGTAVQFNAVRQFVIMVLLGTNNLAYGEQTLRDFVLQPMISEQENGSLILEVGCEGGSIKLFGNESRGTWKFRVETDELDLFEMDEKLFQDPQEQPWAITWRGGLKRLDKYPWTQLPPLFVHHEFISKLTAALKTRQKNGIAVNWDQWNCVLSKT